MALFLLQIIMQMLWTYMCEYLSCLTLTLAMEFVLMRLVI